MSAATIYPLGFEPGQDFRQFLRAEFLARCRRNPRYSLRSFALSLGIESSALSRVLRGQRGMSRPMIERIGKRMGLSPEARSQYQPRRANRERWQRERMAAFAEIDLEAFALVADWYYYAILELYKTRGFRADAVWIAKRLAISPAEVTSAIERLAGAGFIRVHPRTGTWQLLGGGTTTIPRAPTAPVLREYQRKVLKKAEAALDEFGIEARDQSSITFAVRTDRLPEAKELIRRFRREMSALLTDGTDFDEVYQLAVSFFPLSRPARARPERG